MLADKRPDGLLGQGQAALQPCDLLLGLVLPRLLSGGDADGGVLREAVQPLADDDTLVLACAHDAGVLVPHLHRPARVRGGADGHGIVKTLVLLRLALVGDRLVAGVGGGAAVAGAAPARHHLLLVLLVEVGVALGLSGVGHFVADRARSLLRGDASGHRDEVILLQRRQGLVDLHAEAQAVVRAQPRDALAALDVHRVLQVEVLGDSGHAVVVHAPRAGAAVLGTGSSRLAGGAVQRRAALLAGRHDHVVAGVREALGGLRALGLGGGVRHVGYLSRLGWVCQVRIYRATETRPAVSTTASRSVRIVR